MNSYKMLFNNTIVFAISKIGSKAILFFLVPLYTYTLTQEEYGLAELITTSCDLLIPIASLGISNAIYRFSFDDGKSDRDILKCLSSFFILLVFVSGIICLFLKRSAYLAKFSFPFFALIVLSFFNESYSLFLKAKGHTILFALDSIIYILALASFNILLLLILRFGVFGYLYSIIISKIISIAFLFCFGREAKIVLPFSVDCILLKEMVRYSLPLIANSLFWWVMNYLDKYMLGFLSSLDSVGVYTVASKIPAMITTVAGVFIDAFIVSFLKEYQNGNSTFYNKVSSFFSIFVIFAVFLVQCFIRPFMCIYVSENYYDGISAVPFLLVSSMFMVYANFWGVVFSASKKSGIIMYSSLCGAFGNIILNFLLIPHFNMVGAAIATMVSYGLTAIYRYHKTKEYLHNNVHYKNIMLSSICLIIQAVFISINYYSWICCFIVCFAIFIINKNEIIDLCHLFKAVIT